MNIHINRNTITFIGILGILLISNVHLFTNQLPQSLIYQQDMVQAGQWWRMFTYPFVHVSWYHLILDTLATFMLLNEVKNLSLQAKLLLAGYISLTALIFSIFWSPYLETTGLCGLSGIAHGLALFAGLSQIQRALKVHSHRQEYLISGILLSGVTIAKCIYEAISGDVLFSSLHFGNLGTPIVHSHLGGAIGGLTAFIAWDLYKTMSPQQC